MRFNFSLKVTLITVTLALAMVGAAIWQWGRHLEKQALINRLNETLTLEPIELTELLTREQNWEELTFRRVKVSGVYDFVNEVALRNRSLDGRAGVHALTPLKIDTTDKYLLVDRGFIPLGRDDRESRSRYHTPEHAQLFGLLKPSAYRKFMAPPDKESGPGKAWVDQWIRVDLAAIQNQLPYKLLPFYIEVMDDPNDPLLASKVVKQSAAGRNEVMMYSGQGVNNLGMESPDAAYPIATYDITPPPDIHLGYVYEWSFMALLTLGIGVIAQFKRRAPSLNKNGC